MRACGFICGRRKYQHPPVRPLQPRARAQGSDGDDASGDTGGVVADGLEGATRQPDEIELPRER